MLQEAADALESHQQQDTNANIGGCNSGDNNDDDGNDNASVGTHNTQGTQGSRRAFASDSSWIGASNTGKSGLSQTRISEEQKLAISNNFDEMRKKVRKHKQKTSELDDRADETESTMAVHASTEPTTAGHGRPGKLKVPPAFLTGGAGASSIVSPLSMASAQDATANDNHIRPSQPAPPPSRKEAMLLERKKKMDAAIKVAPAESAGPPPSTALAHADERRKLQEKRRKIRQKVKATQQLQQKMAMEAAERNRARTEIVEVPAAASAESAAAAAPKLLSPTSECSIECIFKDEAVPGTSTSTGSAEEKNIEPADRSNNDTDQQSTGTPTSPAPPLPSKPLSMRTDPVPQTFPPTGGVTNSGVPFDETGAVDPTSPPRVNRSPSDILRPTLDDTDSSALPSLKLSPIRRPQDSSSDKKTDISKTNSSGVGDSPMPTLRSRGSADDEAPIMPYSSTPEKAPQGLAPPSRETTPRVTNRAAEIQSTSSSGMLSHPLSVLPKDLPSGKPRKKPAGLPLPPTNTSDVSHTTSTATSNSEARNSEQAPIGAPSITTQEPIKPKAESIVSPSSNTIGTENISESLPSTPSEGDPLLSGLGTQSDNETAASVPEGEGLGKPVENVEAMKKEPLSARSGGRSSRSQSLEVISEGQSHHSSEKSVRSPSLSASPQQSEQQAGNREAGIGSFMSMIGSAYNAIKIDNALDGIMEVVAEGVDKGYKEVSNITTSFLEGPKVANAGTKQQTQNAHSQKGSDPGPKSPGMGPIQIEISRSFNPRIIAYDNDENASGHGSRVSALTFENYEDYVSTTSTSPARATSKANRRYSEDAFSNKDGTEAGDVPEVKEEQDFQPFVKERRFFA